MALVAAVNRYTTPVKWISIALIVLAIFLFMQTLPVGRAIEAMQGWIEGLGVWGPIVFVLIYVAATLVLAPVFLLTVAETIHFASTGEFLPLERFTPISTNTFSASLGARSPFRSARRSERRWRS